MVFPQSFNHGGAFRGVCPEAETRFGLADCVLALVAEETVETLVEVENGRVFRAQHEDGVGARVEDL